MIEDQVPPKQPQPLPQPNPVTRRAYRRQSFWQITLPFLIALLLLLALAGGTIWAAAGGLAEVTRWADVSLIWLISPQLFFYLINLMILIALAVGLAKLLAVLPRVTRLIHEKILLVQGQVQKYSDKALEPVLKVKGFKASADALKQQISQLPRGWR
ncbi:MAG: hypothetical protein MUC85_06090 [Anaerolineales bacterium]|jgi:hypothetical protein|nr:hypothetical protein [Anaerolineales bacterium]